VSRSFAYGLTIASQVELVGAVTRRLASDAPSDIEIIHGEAAIGADAKRNGPYLLRGNRLLFDAPGVAKYLCIAGREIRIAASPMADPAAVAGLLIATALPALLWQRGTFVLHAGGVVLPQHRSVIAIAGPSGVGKSSVLDQLVQAKAGFVGDDTLAIASDQENLDISGLPTSYFLPGQGGDDRSAVAVPEAQVLTSAHLGAVVILARQAVVEGPPIVRLEGVSAVEALLNNRHRPRVPVLLGREFEVLRFCTLLCARVPIYTWRRKDGDIAISSEERAALEVCVVPKEQIHD
jgi:hypothetical protein